MANKLSAAEGRQRALDVLNTAEYQAGLLRRAVDGTLAPAMEIRLWDMAWGKPPEEIHVLSALGDLEDLSIAELGALAKEIEQELRAHVALLTPADLASDVH